MPVDASDRRLCSKSCPAMSANWPGNLYRHGKGKGVYDDQVGDESACFGDAAGIVWTVAGARALGKVVKVLVWVG